MGLDEIIYDLSLIPIFSGFGRAGLRKLAQCAENRFFLPREILFRQGDVSHGSFLIKNGSLQLTREPALPPIYAGSGTFIGTKTLLLSIPRPVTAMACEATSALFITRHSFQTLLQDDPSGAATLQDVLVLALREMMLKFKFAQIEEAA